MAIPVKKNKKSAQVNIRFTPQTLEGLDAIAEKEFRDRSELARFLLEWAVVAYRKAGSLSNLLAGQVRSARFSEELQVELEIALRTLFDRAPSAVVENVAQFLTSKAGKYGGEKRSSYDEENSARRDEEESRQKHSKK